MTTLITVPNGTEISSPTYTALVLKYRTFAKQTAENIIKLAETLLEAKRSLKESELLQFCKEVKLDHEGPTFRKLTKIGEQASRFEPFFDQMPNTWTTIYKLAKLERDTFDKVAHDDRFTPMMKASDVDIIIGGSSRTQIERLSRDVTIDLRGCDSDKKTEICLKVGDLVRQYGFKVTFGIDLEKELKSPPKANTELLSLVSRAA
jgi:hypothetical protein